MAKVTRSVGDAIEPTSRWPALLIGSFVALVVARTMLPEDPGGNLGLGAPFDVLWILLATLWLLTQFRQPRMLLRFGWPDALLLALAMWFALAAIVAMRAGSPRPAMNMLWDWVAVTAVFFLTRQLLSDERASRAVVAVMIGLAVGLSAVAVRQQFVSIPADIATYEAAKDSVEELYQATGQWLEPESRERISFEARLESRLPTATFALSNSLAGFLVPWFVALCGIAPRLRSKSTIAIALLAAIFLAYAIWLTGSRTAGLAAGVGILFLAAKSGRAIHRLPKEWRLAIAVGLVVLVAVIAAIASTSFGSRAANAAWRSLAFRFDYWRATLAMIRDHLLFGVGPGQFQDTYTSYKLLTAPEEIQDPHNWLLEIWSTAGTPAVLIAIAFLGTVVVRSWRSTWLETDIVDPAKPTPRNTSLCGGIVGVALGGAIALASGYPIAWINLLLIVTAIAATWFALGSWLRAGSLPPHLPLIAAAALLVNLFAAGGISFPAVADSLWLLLALQLNALEEPAATRTFAPAKPLRWAIGLIVAALLAAAIGFEYIPVLNSRLELARSDAARAAGDAATYRQALDAAAAADPWSSLAATRLAAQRFADYQALSTASQIDALDSAAARVRELAPRSAAAWAQSAEFAATIFRDTDDVEYRKAAEGYYARAVALYPTNSELQSDVARFWDSIGDAERARAAAAEAIRIDDSLEAAGHADRVFDTAARLEIETLATPPQESQ